MLGVRVMAGNAARAEQSVSMVEAPGEIAGLGMRAAAGHEAPALHAARAAAESSRQSPGRRMNDAAAHGRLTGG